MESGLGWLFWDYVSSSRISHSPTSALLMKNIGLLVLKFIHLFGVMILYICKFKQSKQAQRWGLPECSACHTVCRK